MGCARKHLTKMYIYAIIEYTEAAAKLSKLAAAVRSFKKTLQKGQNECAQPLNQQHTRIRQVLLQLRKYRKKGYDIYAN